MNPAIPLPSNRPADVSTTADPPSTRPTIPPSNRSEMGALSLDPAAMTALGQAVGAAVKGAGGGSGGTTAASVAGVLVVLLAFGAWVRSDAQAVAKAEAEAVARDVAAKYEARTARIELALEGVRDLPEIKRAVDRLIEDQRKLAGSVDTLATQIAKRDTP